ncbi:MAG: hypothetical protein R3181_07575 [Rubricoccaceae bacterium]|nr:hypothetical protein [Rubricoccaceae bacterium]
MEPLVAISSAWVVVGLLLLALVALGLAALGWQRSQRRMPRAASPLTGPNDLDRLGLSEVRPAAAPPPSAAAPAAPDPEPTPAQPLEAAPDRMNPHDDAPLDETGVSSARPARSARPAETASPTPPGPSLPPDPYAAPQSSLWNGVAPEAVTLLLASLRAALHAQSVALLRYDEGGDVYAVDALAGRGPETRTGAIPAAGSALHQVPGDRSISLLEDDALGALQYHDDPSERVGHAAALALDGLAARTLLVADGAAGSAPFAARHLTLFGEYADLLSHLLGAGSETQGDTPPDASAVDAPGAVEMEAVAGAAPEEAAPEDAEPIRPRAEIIAEEMAAARAAERPLALALVVPHDAEAVAKEGRAAVRAAEHALFERLRGVEGSARVEHFGELMAGVFCHSGPTFVEAWAERVAASGSPVHVGVALLRARHLDAEALRADAAAALRAAYDRGEDCVILE